MSFVIPRGIVYHDVMDDIKWLIQALYTKLDDQSITEEFEDTFSSYIGRKYCTAFPFARVAIYYALKAQNLPSGSEVIMPPITIKGILDVVLDLGLKPVFVDIDPDTLCFDAEGVEAALTDKTKAIIITYLFGMIPDIENLVSICRSKNLFIIEDFSQCLNGKFNNNKTGTFGDVGIYSASSIKTLDTYGGGLLVCDDKALDSHYKQAQSELSPPARIQLISKVITDLIRNVATTRFVFHIAVFPLLKLMNRLKPDSTMKHTGGRNMEMIKHLPDEWFSVYTSFQAKIGLSILKSVDESDRLRIKNVEEIKARTPSIQFPRGTEKGSNVYWQLVAYFEHPAEVQRHLHSKKVDTSTTSLEKISTLPAYPYQGATPNADMLYTNGMFIPSYPTLNNNDIDCVCDALNTL